MTSYRITRKKPSLIGGMLPSVIRDMKAEDQVIESFVIDAWRKTCPVPGATLSCFFSMGILQVSVSSSVIRSELGFQKDGLLRSVNRLLDAEELVNALRKDGNPIVTRLVLK